MPGYLDELNESQRAAVLYTDGPSLVIAGAGSGKTRVLTYKITYLLDQGYEPWSILALTFTNKAAREMKERIAGLVGATQAQRLWMGTFHSIFSRILRVEAAVFSFSPNFTIYDASDSKNLIKDIIKEMGLDEKQYRPGLVQSRISTAKNQLLLPEAYASCAALVEDDEAAKIPRVRDIYARYWERCRLGDAMDFDDLLLYTYLLFDRHPEVCAKYASRFRYVLVDEYQDTNYAQHCIVQQLTALHHHVCVVGDDAQSIYSFRGANIDNILHFTRQYKDARLFKLEQNYRSTQAIVNAANSLIAKNRGQIHKEVFSEKDKGEPIRVFSAYSDVEEGEMVVGQIVRLHTRYNCPYSDFAILYRTNAQSRIFEEALRKRGVDYCIYGGLSFYQRKEVKDVIAYFRLTINPNDEEAFKRVINYPARGIGKTTQDKIIQAASRCKVSLWEVIGNPPAYGLEINKGTQAKLQAFRDLLQGFRKEAAGKNAYELGRDIVRLSGIAGDIYQDRSPENLSRQENLEELVNGMHDFCAGREEEGNEHILLVDYLSEISLLTDQDNTPDADAPKVSLMTIHSAKGLEFRNVFVVGMEENLFPGLASDGSCKHLEEERRLCYVAITRAGERCFLSYAKSRFKYGKMEFSNPSRFLSDIDARYLALPPGDELAHRVDAAASRFRKEQDDGLARAERPFRSLSLGGNAVPDSLPSFVKPAAPRNLRKVTPAASSAPSGRPVADLQAGQHIEHERFGRGLVEKVEGEGDNCKATVRFEHAGVKQLLLKFARFKVIG